MKEKMSQHKNFENYGLKVKLCYVSFLYSTGWKLSQKHTETSSFPFE